jgi:hypothetical protein
MGVESQVENELAAGVFTETHRQIAGDSSRRTNCRRKGRTARTQSETAKLDFFVLRIYVFV